MKDILEFIALLIFYLVIIPLILIGIGKIFKYDFDDTENEILAFIVIALTIAIVFIVASLTNASVDEYELIDTRELSAMQDSETLVVSRHSAEAEIYYYYMEEKNDTYYPHKAKQSLSLIRYTENKPVVKVYRQKNSSNKAIAFLSFGKHMIKDYRYEFYLPEGSIKEEFNVDLQ